jgi:hypothetical protein
VVPAAPRIDPRLRRVARRLGGRGARASDAHREVGNYAERLELVRPSYQQVCLLVNEGRWQAVARRATAQLVTDVYFRRRPVSDLYRLLQE